MNRLAILTTTRASFPCAADSSRYFHRLLTIITIAVCVLVHADRAFAQDAGSTPPAAAEPAAPSQTPADDDEAVLDPAEPDFVVINVPTTMRAPVFKGNFRLNHRFAGNLMNGTFGQLAGNLFGIDQGAIIGFEFRMAVARGLQAAAYRSSFDKTVQFHGKYDVVRQRGTMPLSVSALVSIEGTDNFQEKYAPAVGVVLSRTFARRIAVYAVPVWVNNTAASIGAIDHDHGDGAGEDEEPHVHRSTTWVGLATRVRVLPTVYLVGEMAPRIGGYAPDKMAYGFGIEKRVGGHMFSLTFTNTFGTTFAQVARGGPADALYLGFNLGRKYF